MTGDATPTALTHEKLLAKKSWKPLPPAAVLLGEADFFKGEIVKRFAAELFGGAPPDITRFQGRGGQGSPAEPSLAAVLDELRTPSFFSPARLVVLEDGDAFLAEYGGDLAPHIERGFGPGRLIVAIRGKLNARTKFARAVKEHGWIVECRQPYDRPPPWDERAPAWDSELSRWLVARAKKKGLEMDLRAAFALHERAGTDLAVLDGELEKIATYLATKRSRRADEAAVAAVAGESGEDSVFAAVELFLEGKTQETLAEVSRLFERGVRAGRDLPATDAMSVALLFIGALVPRLRALRRAHAMLAEGEGPDRWIEAGLVGRPFLPRFQRHLSSMPPARIARAFEKLYETDRALKSGAHPPWALELFILECSPRAGKAR
ncbi:MAG: DNA polymerase III subunit delta [Planctomycetota bacterium]